MQTSHEANITVVNDQGWWNKVQTGDIFAQIVQKNLQPAIKLTKPHTFSLYFSIACIIFDLLGSPLLCSDVILIFFSFPCFHILLFPSLVMRNGSQCSDAFSCLCHSRAALCVISQCISTTWGESWHLWPFVMERALNGLLCNWHEHVSGGCFNLGAFCTRTLTPGRYLLRFTHLTTSTISDLWARNTMQENQK